MEQAPFARFMRRLGKTKQSPVSRLFGHFWNMPDEKHLLGAVCGCPCFGAGYGALESTMNAQSTLAWVVCGTFAMVFAAATGYGILHATTYSMKVFKQVYEDTTASLREAVDAVHTNVRGFVQLLN
jgi:hypothetical protein